MSEALESVRRALGEATLTKKRKKRRAQVFRKTKPETLTPFQRLVIKQFKADEPDYEVPLARRKFDEEDIAREVARHLEVALKTEFNRSLSELLAEMDNRLASSEAKMSSRGTATISDSRTVGGVKQSLKIVYTDVVSFETTLGYDRKSLLQGIALDWYSPVMVDASDLYELLRKPVIVKAIEKLLTETVNKFAEDNLAPQLLPKLSKRVEDFVFKTIDITESSSDGKEVDATVAIDSGFGDLSLDPKGLKIKVSLEFDAKVTIEWPE